MPATGAPLQQAVRVAIVPGNGAGNVHAANFYSWLFKKLNNRPGVTAVLQDMPGRCVCAAGGRKWSV